MTRASLRLVLMVTLSGLLLTVIACSAGPQLRTTDLAVEHRARLYRSYTLARLAFNRGDYQAAIEYAQDAVALEPTDEQLQLDLGIYLRAAGQSDEAIAALSRSVTLCDDTTDLYLELAANQETVGDNEGARRSYVHALEAAGDDLIPPLAFAQFTARHDGLEPSIEIVEQYLAGHPENAQGWRALGALCRAAGRSQDALVALQSANRLEPENEGSYVELIAVSRDLGRADLADQYAQECFRRFRQGISCRVEFIRTIDSWDLDSLARHNRTFTVLQTLSRAIGANVIRLRQVEQQLSRELDARRAYLFLASIAVDRQRNSRIQSMAAWAAYRIDEVYLAIKYMRRVLDIRPRSAEALNFIGYTYAERGERLDEAEQLIRAALDIWPTDGNIQDSLGWVFYQRGRYIEAVKWLYAAFLRVPDVAEIAEHLGDAWAALGEVDRALEMYDRALQTATVERAANIRKKIDALRAPPPS